MDKFSHPWFSAHQKKKEKISIRWTIHALVFKSCLIIFHMQEETRKQTEQSHLTSNDLIQIRTQYQYKVVIQCIQPTQTNFILFILVSASCHPAFITTLSTTTFCYIYIYLNCNVQRVSSFVITPLYKILKTQFSPDHQKTCILIIEK